MRIIKIIIFIYIILFLMTNNIFAFKKDKQKYPKLVEDLIMPSGFNNDYINKLKNNEPVEFIKPVLRITDFEIPNSFYKAIKNHDLKIIEILKSKIAETGRYILLSTDEDLESVFKEQNKFGNDEFEDNPDIELGNLKIASYVLTGKITQSHPIVKQEGGYFKLIVSVGVSITINNTTTGIIEYTKNINSTKEDMLFVTADGLIVKGPRNLTNKPINSINSTGKDIDLSPQYYSALEDAIVQIVNFIEEKYPIMGEVIEVKDKNIISTVSQKNGIKSGDYIFIIRIGDPLTDSRGKLLGYSKTMIGAAQILSVENNMSTSKIIKLLDKKIFPENNDIVITLPAGAAK